MAQSKSDYVQRPRNEKGIVKRTCMGSGCNKVISSENFGHRMCDKCRKKG